MNALDFRDELGRAEIERFFALGRRAAAQAREVILRHFRRGVAHELKADQSPVTVADKEAEECIRAVINEECPTHGIRGEEHGDVNRGSEFQWVIDPIDGTQSFMHGIPTFGCMLALKFREVSVVGIIDHPALDLVYSAARGVGSFCNGNRIVISDRARGAASIDHNEVVCLASRISFKRVGEEELFDAFMRTHPHIRIFYDCFGHTRVVSGQAALMVEWGVHEWDLGPSSVLIEEAGGRYVSVEGRCFEDGSRAHGAIFGKPSAVAFALPKFTLE